MKISILKQKISNFPQEPGIYIFFGVAKSALGGHPKSRDILYIGKATNLRSRVQSYFSGTETRGHIESMMPIVSDVDFQKTDSVLEALILESNLIKKHQPKYNVKEKDDKSFSYFAITREDFPRVIILRKTDLKEKLKAKIYKPKAIFGPYTSKHQMQVALKIIRKIFPFHSNKQKTEKGCLDFQISLCPGPYAGAILKEDYAKNIRGIKMILEGKKKRLVTTLEKEMKVAAKKNEFEKAASLRNKLFALKHINDVALLTNEFTEKSSVISNQSSVFRTEAYDISNISGTNAVGSMVVFTNGQPDKSQYRKFKIKTVKGSDDVGMMKEILMRRFKHTLSCPEYRTSSPDGRGGTMKKTYGDWPMSDLVLLDGGKGHLNMAEKLLQKELGLEVVIAAVAKGASRKNVEIQMTNDKSMSKSKFQKDIADILNNKNLVKQIMDEAHRFAIGYHRKLRRKNAIE